MSLSSPAENGKTIATPPMDVMLSESEASVFPMESLRLRLRMTSDKALIAT
jgi:hypothetical protein